MYRLLAVPTKNFIRKTSQHKVRKEWKGPICYNNMTSMGACSVHN